MCCLLPQAARLGSWRTWGSAKPSLVTSIKSCHLGFLLYKERIRTSPQTILRFSTHWGLAEWLVNGCELEELKMFFFLKKVANQTKNP